VVSVGAGIGARTFSVHAALRIALFFGGFQAGMPLLGHLAGRQLHAAIASVDHWVAFALLCAVGGHMIYESVQGHVGERRDILRLPVLLLLSLATSIDALAVGLGFACLNLPIARPAVLIGCVAFVMSLVGLRLGHRIGQTFERRAQLLGGLVLIAIGTRILIAHLSA
jgi:putative Mn2+ efflux pump MntP